MATPTASPSAADDAVDDRLEAVYAYSWDNIGTSALWGAVGGLALMLVFELKRSKRSVYWPKRKHMPHRSPSEMPLGLGAWVPTALMMPNEELLRKTGLDAYMMLRYIKMCMRVAACSTFFGLTVLFPVYGTAESSQKAAGDFYHYTSTNVAQRAERLWAPVVMAYLYTFHACFLIYRDYANLLGWRQEWLSRPDPDTPAQVRYSIFVDRLPVELRSDTALRAYFERLFPGQVHSAVVCMQLSELDQLCAARQDVVDRLEHAEADRADTRGCGACDKPCCSKIDDPESFYRNMLSGLNERIASVQTDIRDASAKLERDEAARVERIRDKLTGLIRTTFEFGDDGRAEAMRPDAAATTTEAPPAQGANLLSETGILAGREALGGVRVLASGAIEFTAGLARAAQMLTLGGGKSSTGFVTFKQVVPAVMSRGLVLSPRPFCLECRLAPDVRDIVWQNLPKSSTQAQMRSGVASVLVGLLAIFWTGLISLCYLLSSVSVLRSIGLKMFSDDDDGFIEDSVISFLPVMLLNGLLALLPLVLDWLAENYEDIKTYSEIQKLTLSRYFTLSMINLWAILAGGTISSSLSSILDNPAQVLNLLGDAVPSVAVYLVCLVCVKLFITLPVEMTRVVPLIRTMLSQRCFPTMTPRDRRSGIFGPPELLFGHVYPQIVLVVVILFVYAPIAPVMCPFAFCFFAAANLVYRHQCLYVYVPRFESGGELWFAVIRRTLFGMALANATLTGQLLLKENFAAMGMSLPLIAVPFIVQYFCDVAYARPCANLTLERAIEIDHSSGSVDAAAQHADATTYGTEPLDPRAPPTTDFDADFYRQPSLKEGDLQPEPYRPPRRTETGHDDDDDDPPLLPGEGGNVL